MREQLKQPWVILAGTGVFVLVGLLLLPAVVERHPDASMSSQPSASTGSSPVAEPMRDRAPDSGDGAPSRDPDDALAPARVFDCMIVPYEVLDIGSSVTGVIEEIHAERSGYVEAGQVLARLEASVEKAAVQTARALADRTVDVDSQAASLELGEIRRTRAVNLFEREALSLDTRQEAEVAAELAALELERAREDRRLAALKLEQASAALGRRTIRSPIAGFVVERRMGPGEVVVEEDTVFRLARVEPLRVEAILPSSWFGRIEPGDKAEVVPESPHDERREAEVEIVDPVIDGASGTFGVLLRLPNPDRKLPAGLRCDVAFVDAD